MHGAVDEFAVIDRPYLLVIPIPCYTDESGAVWLERSWRLDVLEHLEYLKDFTLCAPRLPRGSEPDLVRFEAPSGARMSFAFLPPQTSYLRALLGLPRTLFTIWRAIGRADIVHSGIGGWPFPLGWIANPLAVLRGKPLVIVVESDWRLTAPGRDSRKYRLLNMDPIRHGMARWSCNHARLALFTQPQYRDVLRTRKREDSYVTPAVWVNEGDLLETAAAESAWEEKQARPVRLLFAGRFDLTKGIAVLLDALRALDARGHTFTVDIIGQGEQKPACQRAVAELRSIRLTLLDPVPYGKPFFELVRGYHALLVPSLSSEQPRIVFDANSQAVPVIASDTPGLRPHVEHGRTGWLVPPGDSAALAEAIVRAQTAALELRSMGLAALQSSRGLTHEAMHRARSRLIARHCLR